MKSSENYFSFLSNISGNAEAVEQEKQRLNQKILSFTKQLRRRLTPNVIPYLVWRLAIEERMRVSNLTDIQISDFSGQARFLRAICASVPFTSAEPKDSIDVDDLMKSCESIWKLMFYFEMIDGLKNKGKKDDAKERCQIAAMTSLLNAVQGELVYAEQVERRVLRLFEPFSKEIIQPSIGVSADQIVKCFREISEIAVSRMNKAFDLMRPLFLIKSEIADFEDSGGEGPTEFWMGRPQDEQQKIGDGFVEGMHQLNRLLLFRPSDLIDVVELDEAISFFDAFSFVPGTVNKNLQSPFEDDEVRRRPFARVGAEFMLFDACYASFASPHRLSECFDTDAKRQRLLRKRDQVLEEDAVELFSSVIQSRVVLNSYYLPVGKNGSMAERDLLVLQEDCVFVIECKARALREVKQRRDKLSLIDSDVRKTIQEGYRQASDVISYLKESKTSVPIFDSYGEVSAEINISAVKHFIPIVFLDSYYGFVATDLKPWLKPIDSVGFPWVVDRDTFESISLKIDSFEKLKDFLLWRVCLHGKVLNEDEAVFAGFFVKHGAAQIPESANLVQLDQNYSDVLEEEYFSRKGVLSTSKSDRIAAPVWSSMERSEDEIRFRVENRLRDVININTGHSKADFSRKLSLRKEGRTGRNELCPCGSGKKFKNCCLEG